LASRSSGHARHGCLEGWRPVAPPPGRMRTSVPAGPTSCSWPAHDDPAGMAGVGLARALRLSTARACPALIRRSLLLRRGGFPAPSCERTKSGGRIKRHSSRLLGRNAGPGPPWKRMRSARGCAREASGRAGERSGPVAGLRQLAPATARWKATKKRRLRSSSMSQAGPEIGTPRRGTAQARAPSTREIDPRPSDRLRAPRAGVARSRLADLVRKRVPRAPRMGQMRRRRRAVVPLPRAAEWTTYGSASWEGGLAPPGEQIAWVKPAISTASASSPAGPAPSRPCGPPGFRPRNLS
jgi:hypothetical protein